MSLYDLLHELCIRYVMYRNDDAHGADCGESDDGENMFVQNNNIDICPPNPPTWNIMWYCYEHCTRNPN